MEDFLLGKHMESALFDRIISKKSIDTAKCLSDGVYISYMMFGALFSALETGAVFGQESIISKVCLSAERLSDMNMSFLIVFSNSSSSPSTQARYFASYKHENVAQLTLESIAPKIEEILLHEFEHDMNNGKILSINIVYYEWYQADVYRFWESHSYADHPKWPTSEKPELSSNRFCISHNQVDAEKKKGFLYLSSLLELDVQFVKESMLKVLQIQFDCYKRAAHLANIFEITIDTFLAFVNGAIKILHAEALNLTSETWCEMTKITGNNNVFNIDTANIPIFITTKALNEKLLSLTLKMLRNEQHRMSKWFLVYHLTDIEEHNKTSPAEIKIETMKVALNHDYGENFVAATSNQDQSLLENNYKPLFESLHRVFIDNDDDLTSFLLGEKTQKHLNSVFTVSDEINPFHAGVEQNSSPRVHNTLSINGKKLGSLKRKNVRNMRIHLNHKLPYGAFKVMQAGRMLDSFHSIVASILQPRTLNLTSFYMGFLAQQCFHIKAPRDTRNNRLVFHCIDFNKNTSDILDMEISRVRNVHRLTNTRVHESFQTRHFMHHISNYPAMTNTNSRLVTVLLDNTTGESKTSELDLSNVNLFAKFLYSDCVESSSAVLWRHLKLTYPLLMNTIHVMKNETLFINVPTTNFIENIVSIQDKMVFFKMIECYEAGVPFGESSLNHLGYLKQYLHNLQLKSFSRSLKTSYRTGTLLMQSMKNFRALNMESTEQFFKVLANICSVTVNRHRVITKVRVHFKNINQVQVVLKLAPPITLLLPSSIFLNEVMKHIADDRIENQDIIVREGQLNQQCFIAKISVSSEITTHFSADTLLRKINSPKLFGRYFPAVNSALSLNNNYTYVGYEKAHLTSHSRSYSMPKGLSVKQLTDVSLSKIHFYRNLHTLILNVRLDHNQNVHIAFGMLDKVLLAFTDGQLMVDPCQTIRITVVEQRLSQNVAMLIKSYRRSFAKISAFLLILFQKSQIKLLIPNLRSKQKARRHEDLFIPILHFHVSIVVASSTVNTIFAIELPQDFAFVNNTIVLLYLTSKVLLRNVVFFEHIYRIKQSGYLTDAQLTIEQEMSTNVSLALTVGLTTCHNTSTVVTKFHTILKCSSSCNSYQNVLILFDSAYTIKLVGNNSNQSALTGEYTLEKHPISIPSWLSIICVDATLAGQQLQLNRHADRLDFGIEGEHLLVTNIYDEQQEILTAGADNYFSVVVPFFGTSNNNRVVMETLLIFRNGKRFRIGDVVSVIQGHNDK